MNNKLIPLVLIKKQIQKETARKKAALCSLNKSQCVA
jgi:hypothetical protein